MSLADTMALADTSALTQSDRTFQTTLFMGVQAATVARQGLPVQRAAVERRRRMEFRGEVMK